MHRQRQKLLSSGDGHQIILGIRLCDTCKHYVICLDAPALRTPPYARPPTEREMLDANADEQIYYMDFLVRALAHVREEQCSVLRRGQVTQNAKTHCIDFWTSVCGSVCSAHSCL